MAETAVTSNDTIWRGLFEAHRVRRFWGLGLLALFIHGVVDPFVTYLTVVTFGVGRETNPRLIGPLGDGPVTFVGSHLPLFLVSIAVLCAFTWLFSRASPSETERAYRLSRVVWGLLILWGLLLVANNLWVLATGLP